MLTVGSCDKFSTSITITFILVILFIIKKVTTVTNTTVGCFEVVKVP